MRNKIDSPLFDAVAERTVITCLLSCGSKAFYEIDSVINESDLYLPENKIVFNAFRILVIDNKVENPDLTTILNYIRSTDPDSIKNYDLPDYLLSLSREQISLEGALPFVRRVGRLALIRNLRAKLLIGADNLSNLTGNEKTIDIVSTAESPIIEFSKELLHSNDIIKFGDNIEQYLKTLATSEKGFKGIPTGFPILDSVIGGGLKKEGVHVIGARVKCVNADNTFIFTNQGLIKAFEINKDFNILNHHGTLQNPANIIKDNNIPGKRIVTKFGYNIDVTDEHPILVIDINGNTVFKEAKELSLDDYIILRKGDKLFSDKELEPNYAYMCGLLCGDGCIKCGVSLTTMDEEIVEFIYKFAKQYNFNIRKDILPNGNKASSYYFTNNPQFFKKQNFYYGSDELKYISNEICQSSIHSIGLFLRGLFDTDGGIENNQLIGLTTKSWILAEQVKLLLLNIGIICSTTIRMIKIPKKDIRKPYYFIKIHGKNNHILFNKYIGFGLTRKQKQLDELLLIKSDPKHDIIPNISSKLKEIRNTFKFPGHKCGDRDLFSQWKRNITRCDRNTLKRMLTIYCDSNNEIIKYLLKLCNDNFHYVPIKEISNIVITNTIDFTFSQTPTFIANGFINHNCGKTFLGAAISNNVTKLGMPVLYLDTELTEDATMTRWAAMLSGIKINDIDTGLKTIDNCKELREAVTEIKKRKFYFYSIAGQNHKAWLSVMRQWLMKEVGFTNGKANDCLIVLDYLKIMDVADFGDLKEWQLLGQIITDLHNFSIQYRVPILSFVQLNREGINSSGQGVVAGSDRIIALCSNFIILRKKSQEDFAQCPEKDTGDRKLEIICSRFGPGLDDTQYINLKTDLGKAYIEEGIINTDYRPNVIQNQQLVNKDNNDGNDGLYI